MNRSYELKVDGSLFRLENAAYSKQVMSSDNTYRENFAL